jgi:uncharacterized membrane protein
MRGPIGLLAALMLVACVADEPPATAGTAPSLAATGQVPPGQASPGQTPPDKGFRVCNHTGGPIEVAKAVNMTPDGDQPDIISEGWYQFVDGECAFLWVGKLEHRYYLLYAQNKDTNREWRGDIPICVSRQPFTIRQGQCDDSYYRRFFFQVDTGTSALWTQNLRP